MSESLLEKPKSNRLLSLDVFRGMTIAGMVLVNNPGSWGAIYDPLEHAKWHGWTPTDFVFPFFLFIMGVAMTFSFDKRITRGDSKIDLFAQVIRRTFILFLLGMTLGGFPDWRLIAPWVAFIGGLAFLYENNPILSFGKDAEERLYKVIGWGLLIGSCAWMVYDWQYFLDSGKRIPGVLQRIAACYLIASAIMLTSRLYGRIIWTAALLIGYWLIMKFVHPPEDFVLGAIGVRDAPEGVAYAGALNDWIDLKFLSGHLYRFRPDPEGILSTIPAIGTVLMGILTGAWLHTDRTRMSKLRGLVIGAVVLLLAGWLWSLEFPINKKIWTSSYVLLMAGWALICFIPCYFLNDIMGWKWWSKPFEIYGTNAILVFFASGILARLLGMIKWTTETGATTSLRTWLYKDFMAGIFGLGEFASLMYAISYVTLWVVLTWPLYRHKIFLKV